MRRRRVKNLREKRMVMVVMITMVILVLMRIAITMRIWKRRWARTWKWWRTKRSGRAKRTRTSGRGMKNKEKNQMAKKKLVAINSTEEYIPLKKSRYKTGANTGKADNRKAAQIVKKNEVREQDELERNRQIYKVNKDRKGGRAGSQ